MLKTTLPILILLAIVACKQPANDNSGQTDNSETTEETTDNGSAPEAPDNDEGDPSSGSLPADGDQAGTEEETPDAGNTATDPDENDFDGRIAQIRGEFAIIEAAVADSSYTMQVFSYECPDEPQGGELIQYFEGDEIRKIEHSYYAGDHGGGQDLFYFDDSQLFFSLEEQSYWQFSGGVNEQGEPNGTVDHFEVYRYYYDVTGSPIQTLYKEFDIRSPSENPVDRNEVPNTRVADNSQAQTRADLTVSYLSTDDFKKLIEPMCSEPAEVE